MRQHTRGHVSKRANYGFAKRQKEIKRQKKKAEKAEKKRLKREAAAGADQPEDTAVADELSATVHDRPAGQPG